MGSSHNSSDGAAVTQIELLPGVLIQYASDGWVNLGVPMGRPKWVARKLRVLLDQHNTRLRNIARFSNLRNSVSVFDGVNSPYCSTSTGTDADPAALLSRG